MSISISLARNTFQTTGLETITLEDTFKRIRSGSYGLEAHTNEIRRLQEAELSDDKDEYKKSQLPAMVPSGVFTKRNSAGLVEGMHSGLMCLDYDDVENPQGLCAMLEAIPTTVAFFVSPSGNGVKAFVRISPKPTCAEEHTAAHRAVVNAYTIDGVPAPDEQCKNLDRLCYLAYDPFAFIDEERTASVAWEMPALPEAPTPRTRKSAPKSAPSDTTDTTSDDTALETETTDSPQWSDGAMAFVLKSIPAEKYDIWVRVGMALHAADYPIEVWEDWSRTAGNYESGACARKWKSFSSDGVAGRAVTIGSIFTLRKHQKVTIGAVRRSLEAFGELTAEDEMGQELTSELLFTDIAQLKPLMQNAAIKEAAEAFDLSVTDVRKVVKDKAKALEAAVRAAEREAKQLGTDSSPEMVFTDNPYFTDKGTFLPDVLRRSLTSEHGMHFLRLPMEHHTRIYEGGMYRKDTGMRLEKKVRDILGEELATPPRVNAVTGMLEIDVTVDMPPDGTMPCEHPNSINLLNGVLDITTMELRPHSPDDKWIHQLPVNFDPEARCKDFDAWLHGVQEGRIQDIDLAHEILGVSLLQRILFPQIYILHGKSHTGKSTFLDVMTKMLGEQNISSVSFVDIGSTEKRFVTHRLVGKLANIDKDCTIGFLNDTGTLKKIAGGELVDVEDKGKPQYPVRLYANMIMGTNDLPKSADWSDGWTSRLCILSFEKSHINSPDRGVVERITTETELSGILNHALEGLRRVMETGQHTQSETMQANRQAYDEQNNVVARWFNEGYITAPDEELNAKDVESAFDEWCESENIKKPLGRTKLRETLKRMGVERKRRGAGDNRWWNYCSIRERTASDDAYDDEMDERYDDGVPL